MTGGLSLAAALVLVAAVARAELPPAPPPAPAGWVSRGVARLVALDKVSARATEIEARVGETVRFSTLAITVRSCVVRPADVSPDATAFLDIADAAGATVAATGGRPSFHGWLIVSAPAVSGFEHPTLDVRLVGCR